MLGYRTNIENRADTFATSHGIQVVRAVFARYGATDIDNLGPARFSEVYAELYQLISDD